MTAAYVNTLRTTWVTSLGTAVGNAGKLLICSGTKPATKGTGTPAVLATLTCGSPFFASVTNGVGTATAIGAVAASSTGSATWARLTTSADVFVADLDVTGTNGGGDVTLDQVAITSGATITVTSLTITAPGA